MPSRILNYAVALAYMALIGYGSVVPDPIPGEGTTMGWQFFHNSLHVPGYALMTYLWARALPRLTPGVWAAAAIAVGYGIFLEYLQSMTPPRYASFMDVGLNAAGAGLMVLAILKRKRPII